MDGAWLRTRDAVAIAIAVVGHGAFLASYRALPGRSLEALAGAPVDALEVIEVEPLTTSPGGRETGRAPVLPARGPAPELGRAAASRDPEPSEAAPRGDRASAKIATPREAPAPAEATPRGERDVLPEPAHPPERSGEPVTPPPGDEYGGAPPASDALTAPPGAPGRSAWGLPGVLPGPDRAAPAPTAAAPRPDVPRDVASKVLSGTLDARDKSLGLDLPAGGIVAGVVAEAVRASNTEAEARGTFEVRLGPKGEVLGVTVKSFSAGTAAAWDKAAKSAAAALSSRGLRIDEEGGVTVVVKVDSSRRYPAGSKEKVDVKPVCANEVIEQIADALQDPAAVPAKPAAADDTDRRRKFCIPVAIAGTGDASNFGAHTQTVVRSSFEVIRAGAKKLPADETKPMNDRAPWLAPRADRTDRPAEPKKKKKKKDRRWE